MFLFQYFQQLCRYAVTMQKTYSFLQWIGWLEEKGSHLWVENWGKLWNKLSTIKHLDSVRKGPQNPDIIQNVGNFLHLGKYVMIVFSFWAWRNNWHLGLLLRTYLQFNYIRNFSSRNNHLNPSVSFWIDSIFFELTTTILT